MAARMRISGRALGVALAVVWLFVAWIAYLSWPVVGTGGRVLRLFMLLLLAGLGATLF